MNQEESSNVYRDVTQFVRGSPVRVPPAFAAALLREFERVSDTRRGYVLIIGHWLVRLTEEDDGWLAQRLPQGTGLAYDPRHLHSISPVTLADGWDVLVCRECGREW